jgi:Protein of unknown function (DUF433)
MARREVNSSNCAARRVENPLSWADKGLLGAASVSMSQGNTPGSVGIPDEDVRQVRGTRLSVEFVIGLMADGWSEADIFRDYPGVTHDDIIA